MMHYTHVDSPVGELLLVGDGARLSGLYFPEHRRGPDVADEWSRNDAAFAAARAQLDAYFHGQLRTFDLELAPIGTPFQIDVWQALARIPFGVTTTYGKLAAELGRPGAARAVGAAVGRNPVSIVVPCHRVVGATGTLTGYAGGTDRKRRLLELEQVDT